MNALEFYDNCYSYCPRLANFTKVYVVLTLARVHHGARFLCTLPGRNLFYTFRSRVAYFYDKREQLRVSSCDCSLGMKLPQALKFMARCPKRGRENDDKQLDLLKPEVRNMRGPHALDLVIFMHLSRSVNLGNDLALCIFDFV